MDWIDPSTNPNIVTWDDGFLPSGSNEKGLMVINQPRQLPNYLEVRDQVLSQDLLQQIYAIEQRVWGVYISMSSIFPSKYSPKDSQQQNVSSKHDIATKAIQQFLLSPQNKDGFGSFVQAEKENWHGIGVWVISSVENDVVDYHLDYAEMFRYQHNVICPPIYGATLHVSQLNTNNDNGMTGGDFYVNREGLDHYKKFGYKNKFGDGTNEGLDTQSNSWQKISYKYNRGIICCGDFPHYSSRVKTLPAGVKKRVIMGFNIFNQDVGPHAEKYPEHSQKFNKYVKISQASVKLEKRSIIATNEKSSFLKKQKKFTKEDAMKDPKLAAFLKYLLRKVKEKNPQVNN